MTKRGKIFFVAILTVMAAILVLPAVASAGVARVVEDPHRDTLWIHGRAYNSADATYVWMEVHTELWHRYNGNWDCPRAKVVGGNYVSYLNNEASYYWGILRHTWQTRSFHEWDLDGYSYSAEAKESNIITKL